MSRRVWIQPSDQNICIAGSLSTLFMADNSWKRYWLSYHNFCDKWDRSDRYSIVILCKAEDFDVLGLTISGEETDPQASSAITHCEPEHGNMMNHVTYGNYMKLCRSWMVLDGLGRSWNSSQCPVSVLNSQSCLPKEPCSDHGRRRRNSVCGWIQQNQHIATETKSIWVNEIIFHQPESCGHLGMISLIKYDSRARSRREVVMKFTQSLLVFRGSTEGGYKMVQTLNSMAISGT